VVWVCGAGFKGLTECRRAPRAGPCLTISTVQGGETEERDPAGRTPSIPEPLPGPLPQQCPPDLAILGRYVR